MPDWNQEPPWGHDMRILEGQVRDVLAQRFTASASEGWTVVRTGFDTDVEGPDILSVRWRARPDQVLLPNEKREYHNAIAKMLVEVGFEAQLSLGSTEVTVKRRPLGP